MEKPSWLKKNIKNVSVGVAATVGSVFMHTNADAQTGTYKHKEETKIEQSSETKKTPFDQEYKTDGNFFRTVEQGNSVDMATAKKIALFNAKKQIANELNDKSPEVDLSNIYVIKEKLLQESNGSYTYWLAVEMPK